MTSEKIGEEQLRHLEERYDFAAWRTPGERREDLLIWRFLPMAPGLPSWREASVRRLDIAAWPPATRSAWRPTEEAAEDVLLTLDTYECSDAAQARRWVLQLLSGIQSDIYRQIDGPGEVTFAMPDGAALLYSRANLVCFLRNGGRSVVSLTDTAAGLDRWLEDRPTGEDAGRLAPEISRFDAAGEAGPEGVALVVEAGDPAERAVWLKFHTLGGRLSLSGGRPQFNPGRGAAAQRVTVYAVGPGGISSRSLEVK